MGALDKYTTKVNPIDAIFAERKPFSYFLEQAINEAKARGEDPFVRDDSSST